VQWFEQPAGALGPRLALTEYVTVFLIDDSKRRDWIKGQRTFIRYKDFLPRGAVARNDERAWLLEFTD
jgi:hypothetical protein